MESSQNHDCSHQKGTNGSHLHAHFLEPGPDDHLESHDSKILVDPLTRSHVNVRLGFLQIRHVYEVKFSVEDDLGEEVTFDQLENLFVKIESASPSEDGKGHDIVLTFSALKEKLMKESVTLKSSVDDSKKLTLTLHSRVLGKGKGTPALKTGIHCVRIEWDEDSDAASDWQVGQNCLDQNGDLDRAKSVKVLSCLCDKIMLK